MPSLTGYSCWQRCALQQRRGIFQRFAAGRAGEERTLSGCNTLAIRAGEQEHAGAELPPVAGERMQRCPATPASGGDDALEDPHAEVADGECALDGETQRLSSIGGWRRGESQN